MTPRAQHDPASFLSAIIRSLNAADVPYMVAGSFVSSMHGVPRSTNDIDILIDPTPESLERLLALLAPLDVYVVPDVAREEFQRGGQFNVIDTESAWKMDLVYRKNRAFSRVEFARRIPAALLGVPVFVATPEDTILSKLEWAKLGQSERQLIDVSGILEMKADNLDRAYIESWLDTLGVRELWERVQEM